MKNMRLVCLLTCFNRREKTIAAIGALAQCALPKGLTISIILVDDGSADGTTAAVHKQFPFVQVIAGDGSLYWNGGMRVAFAEAMRQGFDDYLWLNDDTTLDPTALVQLYNCRAELTIENGSLDFIVVGATRDPATGQLSYGGLVPRDASSPNFLVTLPVGLLAQRCKTLNGNCVLIPAAVAKILGNLDGRFVHAIGDWDYGLRATAAGIPVWVASGFVGSCSLNPTYRLRPEIARSIRLRLRHVCSPKEVPPRAWLTYVRRNYGPTWPIEFMKPYASAVLNALKVKINEFKSS